MYAPTVVSKLPLQYVFQIECFIKVFNIFFSVIDIFKGAVSQEFSLAVFRQTVPPSLNREALKRLKFF
jgi:hypothetical protein